MKHSIYIVGLFLVFFTSCKSTFYLNSISDNYQKIDTVVGIDSTLYKLILPYSVSLDSRMNETIGFTAGEFVLGKPESSLGNLFADAVMYMSPKYFSYKPDIAIVNHGGIRVPNLPQGSITLGNIYELMPFDNYLVVLKVKGSELQAIFDLMANKGGWPIAGATYQIYDKKAKNILVGNRQIDFDYIYSIALSDYLATGGDDMSMLKSLPQENNNILLRDLLISYFKEKKQLNESMNPVLDKRVSYE